MKYISKCSLSLCQTAFVHYFNESHFSIAVNSFSRGIATILEEMCSSDVDLNNKLTFALIIDHRRRYLVNFCSNLLLLFALTHISFSFSSPTLWFEVVFFSSSRCIIVLGWSNNSPIQDDLRRQFINCQYYQFYWIFGSFSYCLRVFLITVRQPTVFLSCFCRVELSVWTHSFICCWLIYMRIFTGTAWNGSMKTSSLEFRRQKILNGNSQHARRYSLKSRKTFLINILLPVSYVNFFTSSSQQHNSRITPNKAERKAMKILPSTLTHLMIQLSKILTHKRICLLLSDDMCLSCTVIKQQQSESMAIYMCAL